MVLDELRLDCINKVKRVKNAMLKGILQKKKNSVQKAVKKLAKKYNIQQKSTSNLDLQQSLPEKSILISKVILSQSKAKNDLEPKVGGGEAHTKRR